MSNQIKRFAEEFFRNLKCDIIEEDDVLVVDNVPRGFSDLIGRIGPYRLCFSGGGDGLDFVGKGSLMLTAMSKYLEGAGKMTILRIDFSLDPESEIRKRMALRNCEIESLTKSYRNSFFSRFSFATSFNYLNESERILSEVYVHEGKVVDGDLNGYTVVDLARNSVPSKLGTFSEVPFSSGNKLKVDREKVKRDYDIAKVRSVELSRAKQEEIGVILNEKVESEIDRIRAHYDKALKEFGGDLNGKLEKIRDAELELRACDESERDEVRARLERLRKGVVKVGDDEAMARVEKEREMTIGDAMQKFSLNVDRKLVNTTIIYYPVFSFNLFLKGDRDAFTRNSVPSKLGTKVPSSSGKLVEVSYDPLTKSFSGLDCEVCDRRLDQISLCDGGHICCGDCLDRCGECAGVFCKKCLRRSCKICGRKLCKGCVKMCMACGGVVCATHLRKDGVSGEDRCVSCLRACLRCHGMAMEKHFGEAMDGSKVCGKCLGREKSGKVLERVFRD